MESQAVDCCLILLAESDRNQDAVSIFCPSQTPLWHALLCVQAEKKARQKAKEQERKAAANEKKKKAEEDAKAALVSRTGVLPYWIHAHTHIHDELLRCCITRASLKPCSWLEHPCLILHPCPASHLTAQFLPISRMMRLLGLWLRLPR